MRERFRDFDDADFETMMFIAAGRVSELRTRVRARARDGRMGVRVGRW